MDRKLLKRRDEEIRTRGAMFVPTGRLVAAGGQVLAAAAAQLGSCHAQVRRKWRPKYL